MENRKSWPIPMFGNWDYCEQMPITQYFESARQAGMVRAGAGCENDLFKVPVAMPVKLVYQDGHSHRKVRKGNDSGGEMKAYSRVQKHKVHGRVSGEVAGPPKRPKAASKAVDEDLYKIPPELLYQKPKKKRSLRIFFSGCLG